MAGWAIFAMEVSVNIPDHLSYSVAPANTYAD